MAFSRFSWPGLIIVLMILVSLAGMFDHDLWTPDEPREAAIALEMSRSGNVIIPHLAGKPFVEKPPLFYMFAAVFLKGLGPITGNTAALRLVAGMAGLGTIFFTYLLGKLYFDRRQALLAAAILATMIGFTYVTHRLIIDNLLMFFVTASIWALARAYESNRLCYLLPAGILAAGAFLTKGLIGPAIIGLAWLGVFVPWACGIATFNPQHSTFNIELNPMHSKLDVQRWMFNVSKLRCAISQLLTNKVLAIHLLSLTVAIAICAAWIIPFASQAGPELFREWWWTNHLGRFTGQAVQLGHIAPWYYYFEILPLMLLPWLAPFAIALALLLNKALRKQALPPGSGLLLLWVLGTLALMSLSATKREIYLCVLFPACALLSAHGLGDKFSAWNNLFSILWIFILFAALGIIAAAPFFDMAFIPLALPCGWPQTFAFGTLLAGALILVQRNLPFIRRFMVVTLAGYAAVLVIILPAIDRIKSYGPAFRDMAAEIGKNPEAKIAAWNFDETTRAGFYYYCGLVFPPVADEQELNSILLGRDNRYNAVVRLVKDRSANDLPGKENQVMFQGRMGKRRLLQLVAAPDW